MRKGRGGRFASQRPGPGRFFLFSNSFFLNTGRERGRGVARERQAERKSKGARWGARLSSQKHSILSVTSGNSRRWRQALLTMCVKNARLEKPVASKVPPLSRRGRPTKESHFR